jgi:hypothetical protein
MGRMKEQNMKTKLQPEDTKNTEKGGTERNSATVGSKKNETTHK